jgi:hypothetical protein
MVPKSDRKAVRQRVEEHQREAERRELEEVQEDARESFEALQENLSGGARGEPQFTDFRWETGRPQIKGVEPEDEVVPGAALTISGEHLDRVRAVRIGGRMVESFALVEHGQLHVVVPRDAEDGRIELIVDEPQPLEPTWADDPYDREQKEG